MCQKIIVPVPLILHAVVDAMSHRNKFKINSVSKDFTI